MSRRAVVQTVCLLAVGGCRTTIYVSDLAPPSTASQAPLLADAGRVGRLASAPPESLSHLARVRRASGEALGVLAQRSPALLSARYGLRAEGPHAVALLRHLDPQTGPASLDLRLVGAPQERLEGPLIILTLTLLAHSRSHAGRENIRHFRLELVCVDRPQSLEPLELVAVQPPSVVPSRSP